MDNFHILLIAAAVALGLSVVLRWIYAPRADGAWDGAARRRRDLAT